MALYRVKLTYPGWHDFLQLYLPLLDDGTGDKDAHGPFLFKSLWENKNTYYGEFAWGGGSAPHNRLYWDFGWPDSLTDLLTVPLKVGALVRIWNEDTLQSEYWDFKVESIDRV